MSKIGEVIFDDGHSEDILVVYEERRDFVRVLTKSGEYIYREYIADLGDLLCIDILPMHLKRSTYTFEKVLWGLSSTSLYISPQILSNSDCTMRSLTNDSVFW